ncbi:hypothetical protein [Rhodoligotrophos defluvii]|uniref:hypothetical protein n=1 Tax=Rhodoligotrophos defluvii TaxID=2561934 RepID=UPI0010C9F097|nr:hypothetical protein [Rhodoligotrophos defluvii]
MATIRGKVWLPLFAADQLRWGWTTPALALIGMFLAALAGRSTEALLWLAGVFIAKGLQLIICRRIATATSPAGNGRPLLGWLVAAGALLGLVWSLLLIILPGANHDLQFSVVGIVLLAAAGLAMSVLRCGLSGRAELQQAPPAQDEDVISPAVLARATRYALRDQARARDIAVNVALEPGLPLLAGERASLQRLWTVLAARGLAGCPDGGQITMRCGLNNLGGIRLTVASDGGHLPESSRLAAAGTLAGRHQASLSAATAVGGGTILTVDFPPWQTVDPTPVERRPLVPPTTGQRLLMAVTQ